MDISLSEHQVRYKLTIIVSTKEKYINVNKPIKSIQAILPYNSDMDLIKETIVIMSNQVKEKYKNRMREDSN